jgi:D-lactate dehydrogenase (cytochrome)
VSLTANYAAPPTREWLVAELSELLGDRVSTASQVREDHGHDESYHASLPPDAVVFVRSTEEVSAVLALCHAARVPVVPFGAGTSLEGGVSAPYGGISLDLSGMDEVLAVNVDDMDAVVQAGVTHRELNRRVRDHGLFFSVDPGADATLGGMCATGASGTTTVRYGTMRDNVRGLTAVLADGTVVRTGGRARKSAAGYDLTRLLVGSEGTLAVITEVVVRLHASPEATFAAVATFPDLVRAVGCSVAVLQSGVIPARMELLDEVMVEAVKAFSGTDLAAGPALFFEFHGGPDALAEETATVRDLVEEHAAVSFATARTEAERRELWRARHDALPAAKALRAGSVTWSTDVCVPVSRLAECLVATQRDVEESGLLAPVAGHVGDGNFHLALVLDPADADELDRARALNDRLVRRALEMGGTCTGEHGVGLGKRDHLAAEAGAGLEVMGALKRALDPHLVLNPGKVLPLGI